MHQLIHKIFHQLNIQVYRVHTLHGGDINSVFKVNTLKQSFVIKINKADTLPLMFQKEADSLELLAKTESFRIPKIIDYGDLDNMTYLILEYIEPSLKDNFSEQFAINLAKLHKNQSSLYGLHYDNYIGSLNQRNSPSTKNPIDFYINYRIEPQVRLAHDKGFSFKNIPLFYKKLSEIIPYEKASLIHGDLWSGNALYSSAGNVCLIDPAIAYASREMDVAMMALFGGFPEKIFSIYDEIFPLKEDWSQRLGLWQLYYILVHVNLFGGAYYHQAKSILGQFSA